MMASFQLTGALLVALGGALGGVARFWITESLSTVRLPVGTLVVNFSGAFIVGMIGAGLVEGRLSVGESLFHFLVIGVLGGYTTVSAVSLQTILFWRGRDHGLAVFNLGLSVFGCLLASGAGFLLTRTVLTG